MLKKMVVFLCACSLTGVFYLGCGGGGSSSNSPITGTGVFIDNVVVGLGYVSGDVSGKTDNTGTFKTSGSTIEFKVGSIVLGTPTDVQPFITPVFLVPNGTINNNALSRTAADNEVLDIARFLMSISDNTTTDGKLHIPPTVDNAALGKTLNFATDNAATIDAMITTIAGNVHIYSRNEAAAHLTGSILGELAGSYSGTYQATSSVGGQSGTWVSTVAGPHSDNTDSVSGTLTATSGLGAPDTTAFTGTVDPNGHVSFSGATPGTATITTSGTFTSTITVTKGGVVFTVVISGKKN
ncbi:MAG TPA: hypothetical protein VF514_09625 [Bacteroidota bacterium]